MNEQKPEHANSAADAQSLLNVGLGLQSREAVIWALCELLDGEHKWWRIQEQIGATQQKCEHILAVRDAVHDEWMKMPNVKVTDAAPHGKETKR